MGPFQFARFVEGKFAHHKLTAATGITGLIHRHGVYFVPRGQGCCAVGAAMHGVRTPEHEMEITACARCYRISRENLISFIEGFDSGTLSPNQSYWLAARWTGPALAWCMAGHLLGRKLLRRSTS